MTPDALVRAAQQARQHAYAPYSAYAVGAAVQTRSGKVFTGANVENASYGLTVCAERVAIWKAVSEGEPDIAALAVVAEDGARPCGACRQVLHEFGPRARVYLADPNGATRETSAQDLLPDPFGPESLTP
jgi:cytidine deaminase